MSLQQKRGHKQSVVTALMSSVYRYIVAEDKIKVRSQLSKLHDAFQFFEDGHEQLLVSIVDDPEEYSEETLKFVNVEKLYTESVKNAKLFLNDNMNKTMDDSHNPISIPKMELVPFDGRPDAYLPFMCTFNETLGKSRISAQAKLTHLLRYTVGKARLAIEHCSMISNDGGYDEALNILKNRFGDKYMIATSLIDNLRTGRTVHSADELQTLSDKLCSAKLILKSKGTYSELDSQHNIKIICERLNAHLNSKWCEHVFFVKITHQRYPTFEEFVSFVKEKAAEANDPLYGQSSIPPINRSSFNKSATNHNSISSLKFNVQCVLCKLNHHLFKCDQFAELDHKGRIDFVTDNNICINCLRHGHKLDQCKYESFCQAVGCNRKHNRSLHRDGSVVNNSVNDRHSFNVFMPIVDALVDGIVKVSHY